MHRYYYSLKSISYFAVDKGVICIINTYNAYKKNHTLISELNGGARHKPVHKRK